MIVYRKAFLGLHLLFRLYGSAILRTAIWGVLAGGQTALLYAFADNYVGRFFQDGRIVVYSLFIALMSLLVIFRQNASYGRFHEGRTKLQAMSSAWLDACVKAMSFDGGTKHFKDPDAASSRFRLDCVHLFSLMHGVAVQFLRSDWLLENLAEHDESKLPPWDAANSVQFKADLVDYFILRSVSHRRTRFSAAHPIPVVGLLSADESAHLRLKLERTPPMSANDWDGVKGNVVARTRQHFFANSQGKYVRGAAERIYTVYYWVHEMCRYLCDTPFPFTWAQLLLVLLLALQFTAPFVIVSSVSDKALGIVFSVIVVQAYWALNEVARELEDPYCFEPNDIPLARLQYQFNERILAAANAQLPSRCTEGSRYRLSLEGAVQAAAHGSLGAPDGATTLDAMLELRPVVAEKLSHDKLPPV